MDWFFTDVLHLPSTVDVGGTIIIGVIAYFAGLFSEVWRQRIARRLAWRVYHAGVHLPSWRRR
jgi:hypothetical protein